MSSKKLFSMCLAAFVLVFMFAGCADVIDYEKLKNPGNISEEKAETDPLREFFGEEVSDETVKENIFAALNEVEINTRFISDFKKIEDGETGERFSFIYQKNLFIVSMDSDSTVYSVRVGEEGEDVYLKGYESYKAEDYFVPEFMKTHLLIMAENAVELAFEYPNSFEFSEERTFEREGDYYHLTINVTVEGFEEENLLEITYFFSEEENTLFMEYVAVNGKPFSNFTNKYERPERQPVSGE